MEYLEESDDGDDHDDCDSDDKQEEVLLQNNLFYPSDPYGQTETIEETNPLIPSHLPLKKGNCSSPVVTPNRIRVEPEAITRMDLVDFDASASSSSCFEFDCIDNTEENQLHMQNVMNSELRDPHVVRQEPTVAEKPPDFVPSNFLCDQNFMHDNLNSSRNQCLAVQDACDKTSMVAYCLIGCVLDEFAQIEGLDLASGDASYLRGDNSIQKDSGVAKEEHISYKKEVHGSVNFQLLEELLPSFPKSGKEGVKELMGLK